MIDLKSIENDIAALEEALHLKRREYQVAKENNLKEQYGKDFGCDNCAFSCCVDVQDRHTYCTKHKCIYCNNYCDEYMPDNELSLYIRENHYYDEYILSRLQSIMDELDLMKHPELHKKAIEILKLIDQEDIK